MTTCCVFFQQQANMYDKRELGHNGELIAILHSSLLHLDLKYFCFHVFIHVYWEHQHISKQTLYLATSCAFPVKLGTMSYFRENLSKSIGTSCWLAAVLYRSQPKLIRLTIFNVDLECHIWSKTEQWEITTQKHGQQQHYPLMVWILFK